MPMTDSDRMSMVCQALVRFWSDVKDFVQEHGMQPTNGSIHATDLASERGDLIVSAIAVARFQIELSADHLSAISKVLTPPIDGLAYATIARSMLESCALASWLVDPSIAIEKRIKRYLAVRFNGLVEFLKYSEAKNNPTDQSEFIVAKQEQLATVAQSFGCQITRDKKGVIKAIGVPQYSATSVIGDELGEALEYRNLSAVAHGHSWAIHKLCYQRVDELEIAIGGNEAIAIIKTFNAMHAHNIAATAFTSMSKPLWNMSLYSGWDQRNLKEIIERAANSLGVKQECRFWNLQV